MAPVVVLAVPVHDAAHRTTNCRTLGDSCQSLVGCCLIFQSASTTLSRAIKMALRVDLPLLHDHDVSLKPMPQKEREGAEEKGTTLALTLT